MKVIGLMITWNNFEFFKCALKQALSFCDEVMLAEGCSTWHYPRHSTDGTREYINKMREHPKLKVIDLNFGNRKNYVNVQYFVRQALLKNSNVKPNNWITAWDDDMFFFNKDLPKLRTIMATTSHDTLSFFERRFIYNFRFNTTGKGRWFFHRATRECHYRPLMNFHYKNGQQYKDILQIDDICTFHFNYVKKPERIKARWEMSVEKGTILSKDRFEIWLSIKWKKDEDIFKNKMKIEAMQDQGRLNIYTGRLPEVLRNHLWRGINDVRMI